MTTQNIDWNKEQSRIVNIMRFPLIYIVLVIHFLPPDFKPISLTMEGMMPYTILSEMVSHNFGKIAVPCFFLFSGYFFFAKMQEWSSHFYLKQLRKRISTLLIPYLLWNIVFIIIPILKVLLFDKLGIAQHDSISYYLDNSLLYLMWLPVDLPLWYLRDLICMTILTPVFFLYFNSLGRYGVLLFSLLYVFSDYLIDFPPGLASTSIFFFGIGAYMSLSGKNMLEFAFRHKSMAYILFFPTLFLSTYINNQHEVYEVCVRIFVIVGIIAFTNVIYELSKNERFSNMMIRLSPTVFFIFAFHELYIKNWLKGLTYRTPLADSAWGMIVGWILMPMAAAIICIGIYKLWKRLSPKSLAVMVGER